MFGSETEGIGGTDDWFWEMMVDQGVWLSGTFGGVVA
jgi:hypothetical protein